jgi:hypothetical protein
MGNSSSTQKNIGDGSPAVGQLQEPQNLVQGFQRWIQAISPDDVQQRRAIKPASAYGIHGMGGDRAPHFTPLTELNNWPEKLANQDIVPLLLSAETLQTLGFKDDFIRLGEFVKEWHSCSCAVLYHSEEGPLIIGSANYVGELKISTARHVYDELKNSQLSVRFFKYHIIPMSRDQFGGLRVFVRQNYIDVRITARMNAKSGLDAGLLSLHPDAKQLVAEYARELPCRGLDKIESTHSTRISSLLMGVYALFHFAGGNSFVSVGRVDAPPSGASWIKPVVDVFSGPGSSGAAAIGKYGSKVLGEALHICRPQDADYDNRCFIEFSNILKLASYDDIQAPYKVKEQLGLFNEASLNRDGREFLKYNAARHGARRRKKNFNAPDHQQYRFERYGENFKDKLQNHHIIPIDDMIYLYEYFSSLDERTRFAICNKAKNDASSVATLQRQAPFGEYTQDMKRIKKEQESSQLDLRDEYYKNEVVRRYSDVHQLIKKLTPGEREYYPFVTRDEINPAHESKKYFAYAFWNLFQGYKERSDDPKDDQTTDYSEKNKPKSFNGTLWPLLKHEKRGLYSRLKLLQHLSRQGVRNPDVISIEGAVVESLRSILAHTRGPGSIHPFAQTDWEVAPQRRYQIKTS